VIFTAGRMHLHGANNTLKSKFSIASSGFYRGKLTQEVLKIY